MIGEASLARRPGVPAHDRFVFADKAHKYAIAVFCINEGERVRAPLKRMTTAEDIATLAVYLCSDAAKNLSGQCIAVTAGEPAV